MAVSNTALQQDMKKLTPSDHIQLIWPDDYVSVGPDDRLVPADKECAHDGECSLEDCQEHPRKKRILFRPQVTVNVFSTGGSSAGGSSAGGSGAGGSGLGGAATINRSGSGNGNGSGNEDQDAEVVANLSTHVAALSKQVEELTLLASTRRTVIETGLWNSRSVRPWNEPRLTTEGRVTFEKPFKSTPTVTTSITSADVSNSTNLRVQVYASDIDSTGFTAHADCWADTELYSCEVTWMAYLGE